MRPRRGQKTAASTPGSIHFLSIELDGEGYEHIAGYAYFGWLTDDPSDPASSVAQMEAGREAFPQGC